MLTGHVVGAVVQTMVGLALVVAVALLVGFRPDAAPLEWLAVAGVLAMVTLRAVLAVGGDGPGRHERRERPATCRCR